MSSPIGMRLAAPVVSGKVGSARGGTAVKVGSRVAFSAGMNAAARVGLMVGVDAGVGVGGTGTRGNSRPAEPMRETYRAYTQAVDPGTPSYRIMIQSSLPTARPRAGTLSPVSSTPI